MSTDLKIWHPFTQSGLDPEPLKIARGEGAYLITADGRRILDGISSWWVNLHGHNHPAIVEAVSAQARTLDHVLLAGCTHEPIEQLTSGLRKHLPGSLNHIFFSDNGSTAVEVALKIAIQYWDNLGKPGKNGLVALDHAYHGDTAGAMSVSDQSPFTQAFAPLRTHVHRVHSAHCFRCPVGLKRESCQIDCLTSLQNLFEAHGHSIAAVIVEPLLQGAGGMIVHPPEFLQGIRRLCDRFDVLLIADEVLTGFARTGAMFACEKAGVTPDLMCLAKGITGGFLPMGATVCSSRIYDAFHSVDRGKAFLHGHSYTGNPLCAAAGVASLKIFEAEPVLERVAAIEGSHRRNLARLRQHPAVADTRCIGDMGALELNVPDAGYLSNVRTRLYRFFLDNDLLLRPLGNVIYLLPPYCITIAEIDRAYSVIQEALDRLLQTGR